MLTFGSLFAGIGGFDLGLERAGMRCLWQCEIDPYAVRVLEKHWPDVLRVPDIRELGAGTVPHVDLICGGFPCQDISLAGRGAGIAGERSGLWSEYARVVRELRPRYVVVENVAALLARGLDVVLGDLAALGYDAEWDCIPASAVGAPHRRDRVWLIAYPSGGGLRQGLADVREREPDVERRGAGWHPNASSSRLEGSGLSGRPPVDGRTVADAADLGHERPRQARDWRPGPAYGGSGSASDWWAVEPDVGRVAHGVPGRVDRLRGLGNSLVPQIAEWIGRRLIEWEGVTA